MANASDMALERSCLGRQLAEVEVIKAMYSGKGEFTTTDAEAAAVELLATIDESAPFPSSLSISFTVHLLAIKVGGRHVSVSFSLPRRYPEQEALRVTVDCGGEITKLQHETLNLGAQAAAIQMVGDEAVFQVIQSVQELAFELGQAAGSAPPDLCLDADLKHEPKAPASIHRKLMWFHHIKSSQKRKDILEWGSELRLGGFCKPGFPGVLIFEGEADDVAEYMRRIQRLRWQALQIRGEEEEEVALTESQTRSLDIIRRFPVGIRELPESGMSELAAKCRDVRLEDLFLTALKISR